MYESMRKSMKSLLAAMTLFMAATAGAQTIEDGYYHIKNVGSGNYVNVVSRKAADVKNIDDASATAGAVIRVKAENGVVTTLRSQGVDIPGYITRGMRYVPDMLQMVAEKLGLSGSGKLLGEHGVDQIIESFKDELKMDLQLENAEGGYRLYVKTPSMKPVVDFYKANKANVDYKLPGLEQAINDAIAKLVDEAGMGASFKNTFHLETIWERMGKTLTVPNSEANKVLFLQEVLSSEQNVWDFAHETVLFYMEQVESRAKFEEMKTKVPDLERYWNMAKNIRPDFKYYLVQKGEKLDVISQGNADIINNSGNTIWTLEKAGGFKVTFPEANKLGGKYFTTLYVDFAYTLPEGVKAFTISKVNEQGVAVGKELTGTIPAQTPVLLEADVADVAGKTLIPTVSDAAAPADNLLKGPDYLVKTYKLTSQDAEGLFNLLAEVSKETADKYDYLKLLTAGTVNNKYFFGLGMEDINKCVIGKDCVVRNLGLKDNKLCFLSDWEVNANKAFLVSEKADAVQLWLTCDVDRDGDLDTRDVTAIAEILLGEAKEGDTHNYDFQAANMDHDQSGHITIADIVVLIDMILAK